MSWMLTRAALILAMGTAALPICDSGRVANAEGGRRAAPVQDAQRLVIKPVDHIYPPPLGGPQRMPLRGNFWTPKDFNRAFPDNRVQDDPYRGFETIVPGR